MSEADWADDEQRRLEEALLEHAGISNVKEKWKAVAQNVGTRGARSCAERFKYCRELALHAADRDQKDAEHSAETEQEKVGDEATGLDERKDQERGKEDATQTNAEEALRIARETAEITERADAEEAARKKNEWEASRQRAREAEEQRQKAKEEKAAVESVRNTPKDEAVVVEDAVPAVRNATDLEGDDAHIVEEAQEGENIVMTDAERRAAEIRREVEVNRERLRRRQEEDEKREAKKAAAMSQLQAEETARAFAAKAAHKAEQAKSGGGKGKQGKAKDATSVASNEKGQHAISEVKGKGCGADRKGAISGKGAHGKPMSSKPCQAPLFSLEEMPTLQSTVATGTTVSLNSAPSASGIGGATPATGRAGTSSGWGKAAAPTAKGASPGKGQAAPPRATMPACEPIPKQMLDEVPDSWDD